MENLKNIISKSNIYLFLFAISCIATLFAIKYGNLQLNIFLRILRFSFLLLYYTSLVKKYDTTYIATLISFLVATVFFSFNSSSIYGMLMTCVTRVLLLKTSASNIKLKNINWNSFVGVTLLFIAIGFVILSLYYNDTSFFYVAIVATFLLIITLSISFLRLLSSIKKGNLDFFIAISLFVISDTVFGIQRLMEVSATFLIIASVFYNIAYFLITQSEIRRTRN